MTPADGGGFFPAHPRRRRYFPMSAGVRPLLGSLGLPAALGAQAVVGRVVEDPGGTPAAGAIVTLVSPAGARLAPTVTDTARLDVRLPLRRVRLDAVTVAGSTECTANPQDAPRTVAIWEEVRRALTISDIAERQGRAAARRSHAETRRRGALPIRS